MSRTLTLALAFLLLTQSVPASAQEDIQPEPASLPAAETSGPLNCYDFYTYGSVEADLQPTVKQTVPGTPITFVGALKNTNPYPLLDGTLYVKIFKRDETTFSAGDVDFVVDQFVIKDGITLRANGQERTTFVWEVPRNAEAGNYYAAYFFTTAKRYNLMGLSFTDDIVGNQAPFAITAPDAVPVAKLLKSDTTLNGKINLFAGTPLNFSADEAVTISTTLVNNSAVPKTLPLQWNQYAWDSMNKDNLRRTKTEVVTIPPKSEKTVTYTAQKQSESVVYVTAVTQDIETKSFLNVRYGHDGIPETRTNFLGLSTFPLAKDTPATLFACAQSTNLPLVPGNTLTLSLKDRAGKTIHEYRYEGDIKGTTGGFGESFTPASNINFATLTATLERDGVVIEEVTQTYDCEAIDPVTCFPEEGLGGFLDFLKTYYLPLILTLVIILLLAAIMVYFKKRPRREHIDAGTSNTAFLFLLMLLPSLFFFNSDIASAQRGPCILGPEEEVGGQDGFVDQRGGSACIAWNYIEPPTGALTDHQSGRFYGGCGVLGEGDLSTIGGCISRVDSFRGAGAPSDGCTVYGHTCEQSAGQTPPTQFTVDRGCGAQDLWTGMNCDAGEAIINDCAPTERGWERPTETTVSCPMNPFSHTGLRGVCITDASCAAPPTGGSCTVTSIRNIDSGEGYPRDCYSYEQGGNLGQAVCRDNYTSIGDPVTNETDINNERCVPARDLPIPSGGNCSYTEIVFDPACSVAPPAGGSCTWTRKFQDAFDGWVTDVYARCQNRFQFFASTKPLCSSVGVIEGAAATGSESNCLPYTSGNDACGEFTNIQSYEFDQLAPAGPGCVAQTSCTQEFNSARWYTGGTPEVLSSEGLSQPNNCATEAQDQGYTHWNRKVTHDAGQEDPYTTTCYGVSNPTGTESKPQIIQYRNGGTETIITGFDSGSSCTAAPSNRAPNAPTINGQGNGGGSNGVVNLDVNLAFLATDPDSDNIVYGIDWDNIGEEPDQWLPGDRTLVPSGTVLSTNRSYLSDGAYTFRAFAVDSNGNRSGWTTHTVTIAPASAITVSLTINDSTGPLTVTRGTLLDIEWSSTNAASCSAFWLPGAPTVATTGNDSQLASMSMQYLINCGGELDTVEVIVEDAAGEPVAPGPADKPNFTDLIINYTPSTGFNPATGEYDSVTVNFQTINRGLRDAPSGANYEFQFDRGSNGYDLTTHGSMGSLAINDIFGQTEVVPGPIVFGDSVVRVYVDYQDVVDETDDTPADNERILPLVLPPPNPNIEINADRLLVRSGEKVTLTWNTKVTYPMSCRVFGPGITSVNFDPSINGATDSKPSEPIKAKSEFTISCVVAGTTFTDSVTIETQGVIEEI